jgi:hypothetical protein
MILFDSGYSRKLWSIYPDSNNKNDEIIESRTIPSDRKFCRMLN